MEHHTSTGTGSGPDTNTVSTMKLTPGAFMGVPHTQLNSYIQTLIFYQYRLQRQTDSYHPQYQQAPIPPMPNFTLSHSNASKPPTPHSSNSSVSSGLQKAELLAREYEMCMTDNVIAVQKESKAGYEKYGWRLVRSESVLNPHIDASQASGSDILYIGVGSSAQQTLHNVMNGVSMVSRSSRDPQKALAFSRWRCVKDGEDLGLKHAPSRHVAKLCLCAGKSKKVLVCAVRTDGMGVVPLRIETVVWRPGSVGEVRAYAEYVLKLVK